VKETSDPAQQHAQPEFAAARPSDRHRQVVVSTIVLLLLTGWLAIFLASRAGKAPSDTGLGGDFAVFYTASRMLSQGQNPYDRLALYRGEIRLWRQQHLHKPKYEAYIRAGNPPLFYWLIGPLVRADYQVAAWIWVVSMYVVCGLGFLILLATFGWTSRLLPLYAFLAMPQTLLAAYYGNVDAVVFLGLCLSLLLARRYPVAAGAWLAVAWLKPQYALPLAGLVLLFLIPEWKRGLGGFIAATGAATLATVVTTGASSLGGWRESLGGLSANAGGLPEPASLTGLYVHSVSPAVQHALMVASIAVALLLTAVWWWRTRAEPRGDVLRSGWLWVVWLLAVPLSHFHYEIVLAAPLLAILGFNARRLIYWEACTAVFVLLFSVLFFPVHRGDTDYQSLTLIVLAVLLGRAATSPRYRSLVVNQRPMASLG
jgi:hypothetical protein